MVNLPEVAASVAELKAKAAKRSDLTAAMSSLVTRACRRLRRRAQQCVRHANAFAANVRPVLEQYPPSGA